MNVEVLERKAANRVDEVSQVVADCDIHPRLKSKKESLFPFLEKRWRDHMETYGPLPRLGFPNGRAYPKSQPAASRRDAWPPSGGPPGSDLKFLQEQLLDTHNITYGVLNAAGENGQGFQNQDFGAAFARAINEWLVAEWTSKDPRLKASLVVPYEDAVAAVAEIERRAGDPNFIQILFQSRSFEPYGQRRYWPVYAAAEAANLPIGIHAFGYSGMPISSGGWPSYYIEEGINHAQGCQSLLTSLVVEGVFERFPKLRVVLIESGFGWLPSLCWRLDKVWKRLRDETPHLKRLPSEYIHDHVWVTTQPMEEPGKFDHLTATIDWIGWDRLLFATDYPHWDFDDPMRALSKAIPAEKRKKILYTNAIELYEKTAS